MYGYNAAHLRSLRRAGRLSVAFLDELIADTITQARRATYCVTDQLPRPPCSKR